jgi:hypothetical protein
MAKFLAVFKSLLTADSDIPKLVAISLALIYYGDII